MKLSQIISEADELDYTNIAPHIRNRLQTYPSHFQQWGLQEICKGESSDSVIDAVDYYINKIKDNRFIELLKTYTQQPKNILTLTLYDIKNAQYVYDEKFGKPSKRSLKDALKKGYAAKVFDDADLKAIKIEKTDDTDGAAQIASDLARGTMWCVTDVQTANDYLKNGPLYLIIFENKKLLFHHDSRQLKNSIDEDCLLQSDLYNRLHNYVPNLEEFIEDNAINRLFDLYMTMRTSSSSRNDIQDLLRLYNSSATAVGKRRPVFEECILHSNIPDLMFDYAINVIGGDWKEAQNTIIASNDHRVMFKYAFNVLRHRWIEAEPKIMQSIFSVNSHNYNAYHSDCVAIEYAVKVIKGRWKELEDYALSMINQSGDTLVWNINKSNTADPSDSAMHYISRSKHEIMNDMHGVPEYFLYSYAERVIPGANGKPPGRWLEAEQYIITNPKIAVEYATKIIKPNMKNKGERLWPEAEKYFVSDPDCAVIYAKATGRRWLEAEPYILQNAICAVNYAYNVLKRRWPEAESVIINNPHYASLYAKLVIPGDNGLPPGRWPEAEPIIVKEPSAAYVYARYVLRSRWPEAEQYMMNSNYWQSYREHFKIK